MNSAVLTPSMSERYLIPLISLSDNIKLEIISKLSASMMQARAKDVAGAVDLYSCFHGDWGKERSVEEYCRELRYEALLETKEPETW